MIKPVFAGLILLKIKSYSALWRCLFERKVLYYSKLKEYLMALTIRDVDQHYYMIESLKSLTESNVTTKALIKGGYLAVDLGQQLEDERIKRIKAETELKELKEKFAAYIKSKDELLNALK